jgi:3-isopropylmalate/(R)-2-methylmalate dehydratase large subunit
MTQTMLDKLWDGHVAAQRDDGRDLLYFDRHLMHEMHAPTAMRKLEASGRVVRRPDLTFGVVDHKAASSPGRTDDTNPDGAQYIQAMRAGTSRLGIKLFDLNDPLQGISHVVAPELGIVLPGSTYACPDSHACTVGGLGALAIGLGTTDLEHVLATQTIALTKPKAMRIRFEGRLAPGVTAKDVMLAAISQFGIGVARGYAVEYAGPVIEAMGIEGRLTLCNMAIEMGARTGFVAPDETTYAWLAGRPYAPVGEAWDAAVATWRQVPSDPDAQFDIDLSLDCDDLEPQVTWGIDPSHTVAISGIVPDPDDYDPADRPRIERALEYMALTPGRPIAGLPIDRVFIGSCTNSRLSDLQRAASVISGGHVAPGVTALVVPGSSSVKRAAERLGLDKVFIEAGFVWGESGCSMCGGASEHRPAVGERSLSTTNRNFENRQGLGVRTHLVSPEMAAAGALAGEIADARRYLGVVA